MDQLLVKLLSGDDSRIFAVAVFDRFQLRSAGGHHRHTVFDGLFDAVCGHLCLKVSDKSVHSRQGGIEV